MAILRFYQDEIEQLRAQNVMYREALDFYDRMYHGNQLGDVARQALQQTDTAYERYQSMQKVVEVAKVWKKEKDDWVEDQADINLMDALDALEAME